MPSRQTEPLFLDSCVTAASALDSVCLLSLYERLRRTKERCVARLRLRRPVSRRVTVHMHGVLEGANATSQTPPFLSPGRFPVSSFGCEYTRLEKGWKGHMSVDGRRKEGSGPFEATVHTRLICQPAATPRHHIILASHGQQRRLSACFACSTQPARGRA